MLKKVLMILVLSIFLIFFLFLINSYKNKSSTASSIEIFKIKKQNHLILDFSSYSFKAFEDKLLILDYANQNILFYTIINDKFNLLKNIGNSGSGPHETQRIEDYFLKDSILYLLDNVLHKIIGLNIMTNKLVFEYKFNKHVSRALFMNHEEVVFHNTGDSVTFFKLNLLNNEVKKLGQTFYRENSVLTLDGYYLSFDKNIFYFNYNSSEMFIIKENEIQRKIGIDHIENVKTYRTKEGSIMFDESNYTVQIFSFIHEKTIYTLKGSNVKSNEIIFDLYDLSLNYQTSIQLKDPDNALKNVNCLQFLNENKLVLLENYEKLQLFRFN